MAATPRPAAYRPPAAICSSNLRLRILAPTPRSADRRDLQAPLNSSLEKGVARELGIRFDQALGLVPLLYLLWRLWPPPLSRRRAQISLGLRVLLIALLVFALAGLRVTIQPHQRAIIAVVDLSASTRHSLDAESATVRNLAGGKGADDLFGVVTFGHDAQVELSPTKTPNFEIFQTQPDPSYTDVAGALRLAAGIIPTQVSGETIRQTLRRPGIRWQRANDWITSSDPAYARNKGSVSA